MILGTTTMECGGFVGRLLNRSESLMATNVRFLCGCAVFVFAVAAFSAYGARAADVITLKNGMILEGDPQPIPTLKADPLAPSGELTQILAIDNRLTRTSVATIPSSWEPIP